MIKFLLMNFIRQNIPGYYAIGDIISGQALAHVASAEGILCVEKIAGHDVEALDYKKYSRLYLLFTRGCFSWLY